MHTIFSSEPITTMSIKTWNYFFFSTLFSASPSSHCSSSSFPPLNFLVSFFSLVLLFLPKRYIFFLLFFSLSSFFSFFLLLLLSFLFFPRCTDQWSIRPSKKRIPVLLPVEQLVWTEAICSHGMCEIWLFPAFSSTDQKSQKIIFLFFTTSLVNGINIFSSLRKGNCNIFDFIMPDETLYQY